MRELPVILALGLTFSCSLAVQNVAAQTSATAAPLPAAVPPQATLTAKEIIQRGIDRDAGRWSDLRDYTFHELTVRKRLDKDGTVNKTESELNDVLILGGRPYERLLERDGQPLSEKDARKEQEKLDKEASKRAKETAKDRAKLEEDRQNDRRAAQEIPFAFDFTLDREEIIDGLPVWKIHAEPKPDYKPRQRRADVLKKVRATVWVEQQNYQWVKGDIEIIDNLSWGLFLLRIPKGAHVTFSQMRVNNEVWVPEQIHVRLDARVMLLPTIRVEADVTYSDYKKFQAESGIVGVQEIPPSPPEPAR